MLNYLNQLFEFYSSYINNYLITENTNSKILDIPDIRKILQSRNWTIQVLTDSCYFIFSHLLLINCVSRWPAFVDFLEKTYNLRLPNKKKNYYTYREDERVNI
jgi:hypothetical protein